MAMAKMVEAVGESKRGWDEAVRNAVAAAADVVPNVTGIEVCSMTASVENGVISRYQARVRVTFVPERRPERPRPRCPLCG